MINNRLMLSSNMLSPMVVKAVVTEIWLNELQAESLMPQRKKVSASEALKGFLRDGNSALRYIPTIMRGTHVGIHKL